MAEARLMPGLMLCTRLGLVRLPFGESTSTTSVEGMVIKGAAEFVLVSRPPSSSSSAILGLVLRCKARLGVENFLPEGPEDKDLP